MEIDRKSMTLGFIFSLIGDIFMIQKDHKSFLFKLGIASYAFAHISYILGFIMDMNQDMFLLDAHQQSQRSERKKFIIQSICLPFMVLNSVGFYFYIKQFIPEDLFILVTIYVVIITMAFVMSFLRYDYINTPSFVFGTLGIVLFFYSDVILALYLFVDTFKKEKWLLRRFQMIFYLIGQWMIYKGSSLNNNNELDKKIWQKKKNIIKVD